MKKIIYYNRELKQSDSEEPIYEIVKLSYLTKDEEVDHWLSVIQQSYGEFGEVFVVDTAEQLPPTIEEQLEQIQAGMAKIAMQTAINTLLQGGI